MDLLPKDSADIGENQRIDFTSNHTIVYFLPHVFITLTLLCCIASCIRVTDSKAHGPFGHVIDFA